MPYIASLNIFSSVYVWRSWTSLPFIISLFVYSWKDCVLHAAAHMSYQKNSLTGVNYGDLGRLSMIWMPSSLNKSVRHSLSWTFLKFCASDSELPNRCHFRIVEAARTKYVGKKNEFIKSKISVTRRIVIAGEIDLNLFLCSSKQRSSNNNLQWWNLQKVLV